MTFRSTILAWLRVIVESGADVRVVVPVVPVVVVVVIVGGGGGGTGRCRSPSVRVVTAGESIPPTRRRRPLSSVLSPFLPVSESRLCCSISIPEVSAPLVRPNPNPISTSLPTSEPAAPVPNMKGPGCGCAGVGVGDQGVGVGVGDQGVGGRPR